MSNGANAICWGAAGGGGGSPATPTVAGIVLGCTTTYNTALGCNALASGTGTEYNTAIGAYALCSAASSSCYNTAIGAYALCSAAGGNYNTAVGVRALCSNDGEYNTAIGIDALCSNTSGSSNVASGAGALQSNNTGLSNAAFGTVSLFNNTSGSYNAALGSYALCNNTTGCGNVMVGGTNPAGVYAPVFNPTNQCNRVMVGSTATTNAYVQVAWTVTSDARDKTNVTALPVGLEFVNKLNPVSFQFKESREDETPHGSTHYGFLAQEILEAEGENPVIVDTEDPEKLKITNDYMNAVFAKALQELSAKVEALEAKLAE
jgi:hypothetical protein